MKKSLNRTTPFLSFVLLVSTIVAAAPDVVSFEDMPSELPEMFTSESFNTEAFFKVELFDGGRVSQDAMILAARIRSAQTIRGNWGITGKLAMLCGAGLGLHSLYARYNTPAPQPKTLDAQTVEQLQDLLKKVSGLDEKSTMPSVLLEDAGDKTEPLGFCATLKKDITSAASNAVDTVKSMSVAGGYRRVKDLVGGMVNTVTGVSGTLASSAVSIGGFVVLGQFVPQITSSSLFKDLNTPFNFEWFALENNLIRLRQVVHNETITSVKEFTPISDLALALEKFFSSKNAYELLPAKVAVVIATNALVRSLEKVSSYMSAVIMTQIADKQTAERLQHATDLFGSIASMLVQEVASITSKNEFDATVLETAKKLQVMLGSLHIEFARLGDTRIDIHMPTANENL